MTLAWLAAIAVALAAPTASGQVGGAVPPAPTVPLADLPHVQSGADALAQDAAAVAALLGIDPAEAARRLWLQEASVAATDALAARWRGRLAGLSLAQWPDYHLDVLLTGTDPVPDEVIMVGRETLPVRYRTGAAVTRDQLRAAITDRRWAIEEALGRPAGLGVDAITGALVAVLSTSIDDPVAARAIEQRVTTAAGVPVRVRNADKVTVNLSTDGGPAIVEGGARVFGVNPVDRRRYACTTGFAVTDGVRDGVVTAAHCPDSLSYVDPVREEPVVLAMVGQWGWGYQDVQVHLATTSVRPFFYADTAKTVARPVTGARTRASTRAGDMVCHRGERTGYSCASVELTDFAPAGALCGGACLPTWVTVAGPTCKGGDSGAPVFAGTTAFGIVKGGTYRADGSCAFYFYMSVDYLPEGWSLLTEPAERGAGNPIGAVIAKE